MKPIFALGLPHGSEWIVIIFIVAILIGAFALLLWAIARRK